MAKRVLIYSTAYLPLIGGAELAVKELTDRLPDYEFDLVTAKIKSGLPSKEQVGRVTVYRLGLGWGLDKVWLALVGGRFGCRLHRGNKYDLVWSIMASYSGLAALNFKNRHSKVPLLLTLQEGDDLKTVERKMKLAGHRFSQLFAKANYIQTISHYLARWAEKLGAKARVEVVPNGVDLKTFGCQQEKLNRPVEPVVFTASRLVYKNGLDDLIKSLKFLPEDVNLRIAGAGPEETRLKNLVQELALDARVNFLGSLSAKQVAEELSRASVFARPSRSEGLGNSFLEAMAAGVPVVGTLVGGIPDFLAPGESGFAAEPDNPESIAGQIKFILDPANQEKVWQVVNKARALVKQQYDWDKIAQQMAAIFNQLIIK
jgi:glycosyltransferase involved in cell wall biosynthesis